MGVRGCRDGGPGDGFLLLLLLLWVFLVLLIAGS